MAHVPHKPLNLQKAFPRAAEALLGHQHTEPHRATPSPASPHGTAYGRLCNVCPAASGSLPHSAFPEGMGPAGACHHLCLTLDPLSQFCRPQQPSLTSFPPSFLSPMEMNRHPSRSSGQGAPPSCSGDWNSSCHSWHLVSRYAFSVCVSPA